MSIGFGESDRQPNLSPMGNKLRRLSSAAAADALAMSRHAPILPVEADDLRPKEGEEVCSVMLQADQLNALDGIFAEIISLSQTSMDIWDMEVQQVT